MSDHRIRVLRDDELHTANTLFRASLHVKPLSDAEWEQLRHARQPGRAFGAFEASNGADGALIGTARSTDAALTVPGGAQVSAAMVSDVGVRADRTRRGVLTGLMRAQLSEFAERGVVAAALHASEGTIYGRFGYGVGALLRRYTIDRKAARLHPAAPAGGEVELLDIATAFGETLPALYDGLSRVPGMLTRPVYWWRGVEASLRREDDPLSVAVHYGPRGADGYVMYRVSRPYPKPGVLTTVGLHYDNPEAFAGLWRFLLAVDLVDTIEVDVAPTDEPLELLFADPRACRVTGVGDDLWVRLVDVRAALAARAYDDGGPLVVDVDDPVLADNSGRYVVGSGEVRRTDAEPDLRLDVAALAMVYLGAWRPSALVATGRITVRDSDVTVRADSVFRTRTAPWCGTFF